MHDPEPVERRGRGALGVHYVLDGFDAGRSIGQRRRWSGRLPGCWEGALHALWGSAWQAELGYRALVRNSQRVAFD
jgi:hypothetical protein